MRRHELRLTLCAPAEDDPRFAEISVDSAGANYTWAEIYLDSVHESAKGPRRVEAARPVVRMWFDGTHFDVPYAEVVATLDRARTLLLVAESHVAPE
ncbi:MAG: hypothetical protein ACRDPV_07235 [Gaiellaceae bacterium]